MVTGHARKAPKCMREVVGTRQLQVQKELKEFVGSNREKVLSAASVVQSENNTPAVILFYCLASRLGHGLQAGPSEQ